MPTADQHDFDAHLAGYLAHRDAQSQVYYDREGYTPPYPRHYVKYKDKYAVVIEVSGDSHCHSVYIPLDDHTGRFGTPAGTIHLSAGCAPSKTTRGSIYDYPAADTLIPVYTPRPKTTRTRPNTIKKLVKERCGVTVNEVRHDRHGLDIYLDDPTRDQRTTVKEYAESMAREWCVSRHSSDYDDTDRYSIFVRPPASDCRDTGEASTADCLAVLDGLRR